jgi:hypothetical protein
MWLYGNLAASFGCLEPAFAGTQAGTDDTDTAQTRIFADLAGSSKIHLYLSSKTKP